ncbi:hypothetical protein BUALT_Bualt15G0076800 [Buddleja alternifolia]|uniref:EamA domain-containing protein n=1 Tax=Buddleja alternifolia TaxID=168488 RepID=A0AAV6WLQ3_9LAMI|nr:hypothetical protein BUALT_Bualt15G0076800 [Buddleja alternifolia]
MASYEKICNSIHGLKPTLIMVLVQTILSLVNVGYKLAANDGMSLSVLVAYRFMFGAAFIVPIAFFVERYVIPFSDLFSIIFSKFIIYNLIFYCFRKKRPKLTWTIVFYAFLCGLFGGALGQNLYLKSLVLTSATFVSAMANLVPALTFVVAICLRLEKLGWNTTAGKAKVLGTLLGIGGAMLFTFYEGPELKIGNTGINLLETTSTHHHHHSQTQGGGHNLVLGLFLALAGCVSYSLWLIIQAKAAELYPCPYSITAMMTLWGSVQGTVYALCTERDWNQWILGWDIRLLTVFVAGTLGSGLMFTLIAWCVRMRGPLFVSVFNPLLLVVVGVSGILFLEEKLFLGMVFGAILIVCGLYVVLWGKSKELKKVSQIKPENQVNKELGPNKGSSHGRSGRKEKEDEEEEKRDSHASSEVLGGLYMYP